MTLQEKYGSFFYLGIAGLLVSLALVIQFGVSIYATRDLWYAVYALNDPKKTDAERIEAAWVIARSPSANDRQRSDLALRKDLPDLARYILAEGLTSDAIRTDPKAYALMVAKSEGWRDWLRLMMARPMAYGVAEGYRIAWEPLDELRENQDPAIALLATYTRADMGSGDEAAKKALSDAAEKPGPFQPLAKLLESATRLEGDAKAQKLDEATRWLRSNHPEAKPLWRGWEEIGGKLMRVNQSAPQE
jgi:hypothetical protein